MTKHPDLFAALAAPFRRDMIKKLEHGGALYITGRAVMTRLDEVLGPENWAPGYEGWSDDAVLCRLTVTLPDGSHLTKSDVGAYSKMSEKNGRVDGGDDDKGGFSDALKRAAVLFGVGRHLYDGGKCWASFERERTDAYVHPASAEPLGAETREPHRPAPRAPEPEAAPIVPTHVNGRAFASPPRNGKAMFAWARDREQEYQVGLIKYLNQWAKLQEFPGRMVDWDSDQVGLAYAEATRKLQSVGKEVAATS